MQASPAEVVEFWAGAGPEAWYDSNAEFDAEIRARFLETWEKVSTVDCESPAYEPWVATAETCLGLVILLDQFPRNMFRDQARAFASDKRARAVAKRAIEKGWDQRIGGPLQQFFYMPLVHSECLADQDHAVRLFKSRMSDATGNMLHARAHREIIRRFGRFPFRNAALSRATTGAEAAFLSEGGYRRILQDLQAAA